MWPKWSGCYADPKSAFVAPPLLSFVRPAPEAATLGELGVSEFPLSYEMWEYS
jgi:hypothetical protein